MAETEVIHLVWRDAGIESLRAFLESYREHAAGAEHDLVVLFNGFRPQDVEPQRALLHDLEHRELRTPQPMLDIAAYVWAAERCTARYLCFLNSYSTLLADDWLRKLVDQLRQPNVGAAGATGSWESVYTAYLNRLLRLGPPGSPIAWPAHLYRRMKLRRYRDAFDPMPNPHLRSNGFVVERGRWLGLQHPPLKTKYRTLQFENGKHSMSRQLQSAGLELRVVGRDGSSYPPDQWPASDTYRHGDQQNLLIADNRTRQYADADAAGKRYLEQVAWG